jgi:hypothetical protein
MTTIHEVVNEYVTWETQGHGKNTTYKASIGILEAHGSSKAEALSKLLKRLERAMDGGYYPSFMVLEDRYAIVYRTPCAWFCSFPQGDGRLSHASGTGPYPSLNEAERQARLYLADLARNESAGKEPVMEHAQEKSIQGRES